ncbi:MAG: TetM/TetW/TetO/TetS family tetracycline resistance ribosomal protection protein [Clostridiales bacterium]|nr:TetM/TetW/TetO/TetS family tetracycline resistance ribosomal protection protein [Clostridiales bacterium]
MGGQPVEKQKKRICVGLLAHVDAGKTTLSESMLYTCGAIRKPGRVDHGDAFLDTYEMERSRGITIFSKQAILPMGELQITLMDTPGHVDFSAEMERTLQVLDYGILVISGADGVQGHTQTLWKLLKRYGIPTFLFINKMDQPGTDREALMQELKKRLDEACLDFSGDRDEEWQEQLAMCEEELLEAYLENGSVDETAIPRLIRQRKIFPCFFGSALKMTGVEEFLHGIEENIEFPKYPEQFGAKVYKIARDSQNTRLTYMKITGGSLKVKSILTNRKDNERKAPEDASEGGVKTTEVWEEKADQIRIYSGEKYEAVNEAKAGTICAVTGLTSTYPGQGLGLEAASDLPVLEPVLTYQIKLPEECDIHRMLLNLRQLEEEEPLLHIVWNEELDEIHAQVMGEVQIEILKSMIKDRFGVSVEFGSGNIVYKETIKTPVEGVGHFEPLRHYAEVHLLLEPGERGSGLQFGADCSEDVLDRNWQRLILTHLEEKEHRGVLTGSPITDMRITLVTGRAHLKHTEGGDFRQATYRAVRQGIRKAESMLLEPYYEFRLEVPSEMIGRGMSDIQKMCGEFAPPELEGDMSILTGKAPVVTMRDYQTEVISYTRGRGRLFCTLKGYFPCHNEAEVIQAAAYDPEADMENPTGSVFCAHGAGFVVNWDQVEEYMHLESGLQLEPVEKQPQEAPRVVTKQSWKAETEAYLQNEKELEEIFARTYGPMKSRVGEEELSRRSVKGWKRSRKETNMGASGTDSGFRRKYSQNKYKENAPEKQYLLVDGYNIIFAWEDLKELAEANIDAARDKLMDILCNYQGYKKCTLILVFDAYKVKGNPGSVEKYHNIHVVYTKEAETADQYIEKTVHEIGKRHQVTVATSDRLEQVIILGQGGSRMSARELQEEIQTISRQIREEAEAKKENGKNYLFDALDEETAKHMEDVRLGKTQLE